MKTCYKQNFYILPIVSVAKQAGLAMTRSETPKTGFLTLMTILNRFSFGKTKPYPATILALKLSSALPLLHIFKCTSE